MKRLSVSAVKSATRPGRFSDGDGLYLVVQPGGSKSWVCRVQKSGNRRDFGLGSVTKVSLADARGRAREVRIQVEMGLDPLFERRKAKGIPTFREAAAKVLAANRKTWKNAKSETQWRQSLEDYAFPQIGKVIRTNCCGGISNCVLAPGIGGGGVTRSSVKMGPSSARIAGSASAKAVASEKLDAPR